MPPLATDLRRALERTVVAARDAAERGAAAALTAMRVFDDEPGTNDEARRALRLQLRARARALGAGNVVAGRQPLVEEVAYEHWHRMLFARFLSENGLLIHPEEQTPVTIDEVAELAAEIGEADPWPLAAAYAAAMLPGIFRNEDPVLQLRLAPEDRAALEALLLALPGDLFRADDALGWVYQFWQSKKKDEVNKSGRKIGGADIAPVTQLFTEDYMVRFLLENSLGAWWAARHPHSPLNTSFTYLRYRDDGTPAAGTFPGWPATAAAVTVMDPCCGSGHFLVAAFEMLRRMRMEEEGLSAAAAVDTVLRDNIHGLELDPRCTQIAVFALALAAWKVAGYRPLPPLNVACSGIAVQGQKEEWRRLAGSDQTLQYGLERLYELFKDAPDLGSLIDPAQAGGAMFVSEFERVAPLLEEAFAKDPSRDAAAAVFGAAAAGVARAVALLAGKYTLVTTNVPYLARGKQDETLKRFAANQYPVAKSDLATMFIERCRAFAADGGSYAMVTPQNWLFLGSYKKLREQMLREETWDQVTLLGTKAFQTPMWDFNVALLILTQGPPSESQVMTGIEASASRMPEEKAALLQRTPVMLLLQSRQLRNPDHRVALGVLAETSLLSAIAVSQQGIKTGDDERYRRQFWEPRMPNRRWRFYQGSVKSITEFGGRECIVDWEQDGMNMARLQGIGSWSRTGVVVSQMGSLPVTLYSGDIFDSNVGPIVPSDPDLLPAIWSFCSSPEFNVAVRRIDQKLNVTNATLVKVPFDLERWQKVAEEQYPNGLPEPYSNDPTQWLFKGTVTDTTEPLQVAVARLLGYRWPEQASDGLSHLEVEDGIVPLVSLPGVTAGAERLRALLAAAFGAAWTNQSLNDLLAGAGYAGRSLEQWLRDGFFTQHCALFHQRPFIWQIWDGERDGFSALVNYHRLDRRGLESLAYHYLGAWIERQRAESAAGTVGADRRLNAALTLQGKLAAILAGEPPYDIFVRWKPLAQQPLGWEPDLDDGVRLNIRPFMQDKGPTLLRSNPNVKWGKDRGANPDGSERLNDRHYTLAQKRAARSSGS